MCVDGECVRAPATDGGTADACGGCPDGTWCNTVAHRCQAGVPLPDPGTREVPEPDLRGLRFEADAIEGGAPEIASDQGANAEPFQE